MSATGLPQAPSTVRMLINGALFNAGWLACVVWRNEWSFVVAALVIALYLYMEPQRGRGLVVVVVAAVIGFAVDNAMLDEGILFPEGAGELAPVWMTLLWPLLATTLNMAFRPLQQRLVLAGVLGAVSAPMSYLGAVKLGAAEFGIATHLAMISIGFVWLILFPAGLLFTRRLMLAGIPVAQRLSAAEQPDDTN